MRSLFCLIGALLVLSCSDASQPAATETGEAIVIDFETFDGEAPTGLHLEDGAITGDSGIENLIARDADIFIQGESSLRITGNETTTEWRSLSVQIPEGHETVTARMFVKGEDLEPLSGQFFNNYAGFWFDGLMGDRSTAMEQLPTGTFDWTEVTVNLYANALSARNARFTIFTSISGTLWVDDLTITFDEAGTSEDIQGPLAEYIGEVYRPTVFMELDYSIDGYCPDSITGEDALEDASHLRYIFENGYSGYEYWQNNGIDFNGLFDELEELAGAHSRIAVEDFEEMIAEGLQGIQDGHLSIQGHGYHSFLNRKSPYFADVIVEGVADGDFLTVVVSRFDGISPGMVYSGPVDNLFRIPSRTGTEQYQLGVFSDVEVSEAQFSFFEGADSGEPVLETVPLHGCRLSEATHIDSVFCLSEEQGIPVVRSSDFRPGAGDQLQNVSALGSELAESEKLIVDLMGNTGGSSRYAQEFVTALNGIAQWRMYYAVLVSPATVGAYASIQVTNDLPQGVGEMIAGMRVTLERLRSNPVRIWMYIQDVIQPRRTGSFQGKAVFLTDRNVASSGEAFVDFSRCIPNAVLMGENTAGVGTFGEICRYRLPNSGIKLAVPGKLFVAPGFEEGVGYLPDYWLDTTDPVGEAARWLNDPDGYQFRF